jgi:hypothetical protein
VALPKFASRVGPKRRVARSSRQRGAIVTNDASSKAVDPNDIDEEFDEPIPAMQQLLDNPFLLLFIGVAMPTVLYVIWGVMEIVGIPIAK